MCIFRASSQQRDMQSEQSVSHVIRFFSYFIFLFFLQTEDEVRRVRDELRVQVTNEGEGEWAHMTSCLTRVLQTNVGMKNDHSSNESSLRSESAGAAVC